MIQERHGTSGSQAWAAGRLWAEAWQQLGRTRAGPQARHRSGPKPLTCSSQVTGCCMAHQCSILARSHQYTALVITQRCCPSGILYRRHAVLCPLPAAVSVKRHAIDWGRACAPVRIKRGLEPCCILVQSCTDVSKPSVPNEWEPQPLDWMCIIGAHPIKPACIVLASLQDCYCATLF